MAKLNISDFDDFNFTTQLASESFNALYGKAWICLDCQVTPVTNEVIYIVLIKYAEHNLSSKFIFLGDAIDYYNRKLEEFKGREV